MSCEAFTISKKASPVSAYGADRPLTNVNRRSRQETEKENGKNCPRWFVRIRQGLEFARTSRPKTSISPISQRYEADDNKAESQGVRQPSGYFLFHWHASWTYDSDRKARFKAAKKTCICPSFGTVSKDKGLGDRNDASSRYFHF